MRLGEKTARSSQNQPQTYNLHFPGFQGDGEVRTWRSRPTFDKKEFGTGAPSREGEAERRDVQKHDATQSIRNITNVVYESAREREEARSEEAEKGKGVERKVVIREIGRGERWVEKRAGYGSGGGRRTLT